MFFKSSEKSVEERQESVRYLCIENVKWKTFESCYKFIITEQGESKDGHIFGEEICEGDQNVTLRYL
jgi:hypothetical protein